MSNVANDDLQSEVELSKHHYRTLDFSDRADCGFERLERGGIVSQHLDPGLYLQVEAEDLAIEFNGFPRITPASVSAWMRREHGDWDSPARSAIW